MDTSTSLAPPPELPTGAQAKGLLDECFRIFHAKLVDIARASIEMCGDLFEGNTFVAEKDVDEFRLNRGAWVERFDRTLSELYERRMVGTRRKGRRPDFDASLASLKVLTAFDQEKQAALVAATAFLQRITRRELDALDLRIEALMPGEPRRDVDHPFGPLYILDAIGMSARAVYPNPRIWRAFMERVVADLTPTANKVYITLNRYLADQGVLPEIKAALRARSDFRPVDDKDLIPTFSQMLHDAGPTLPTDVEVPELAGADAASVFDFEGAAARAELLGALVPSAMLPNAPAAEGGPPVQALPADLLAQGLAELGEQAPAPRSRGDGDDAFGAIDPLMALGTSTPLFNTLGHWQRLDLPSALAKSTAMPEGTALAAVPLNLIPHIRAAVASQLANPTDRITMDVIALLFDYIFRDPSIPDAMRRIFSKLQVPVLKAALLDRTFFSDRSHAARRLLDHLADAAIGATHNPDYEHEFEQHAVAVVERVCRDFEIDLGVFATADLELAAFIDAERKATEIAVKPDVAEALATEAREVDRAEVLGLMRDKLAGLDVPFAVRGFIETIWTDYLTKLHRDHGAESAELAAGVKALDDLLWSIVAKERTGQKARLTKMIPGLVVGLRKGCTAVAAPAEKSKAFFDALYPLHVAAIKPPAAPEPATQPADATAKEAVAPQGVNRGRPEVNAGNVHDFVAEMAVGTWLVFRHDDAAPINARLTWVSPRHTRYIFTSRSRREALMFSPEELAWELNASRASLLLEPVPLFDRAVSSALDTLAAQKPAGEAAGSTRAA